MQLFNKLNKPIFLKEDSDTEEYISRLKELQEKATGNLKEKIDLEIKLATIGQVGEKNIAFELKNSELPMYILHDIHLEIEDLSAQIDYIIVTRKVVIVIECKNLIGNITVDKDGNFIRDYQLGYRKIREGIYSPITQNLRHLAVLKQITKSTKSNILLKIMFDKYFDENYKSVVVLANPKTILNDRYAKKDIKDMIIRADQLNKYIKDINGKSTNPPSSDPDMERIASRILSFHTPSKSDYTKKYKGLLNTIDTSADAGREVEDIKIKSDDLYERLKTFRLEKSREESIKAYYIFTDAQLKDLVEKLPKSKEELKAISGFGDVKVEKYGDMIINIINN